MIALLGNLLSDDLLREVAGVEVRKPLSVLHSAPAQSSRQRHILLLAERGGAQPFALVKWGRGAWAEGLRSEHAAMSHVRASSDGILAASCPPCWGPFDAGDDTLVTVERYFPSQSAYSQMRTSLWPHGLVRGHFDQVSAWLTRFGTATLQGPRPLDEPSFEEYIAKPLRTFAEKFGPSVAPPDQIERIIAEGRAYLGVSVPFTAEHGDFWPSNVLLPLGKPRGLFVVDWEYYRPVLLGGFDMLFFCTTYSLELPGRPLGWVVAEEAIQRAFVRRTSLGGHIERLLDQNCAATGLPRGLVPLLMAVMIARMALRHASTLPNPVAEPGQYWPTIFQVWCRRPLDSWLDTWARSI